MRVWTRTGSSGLVTVLVLFSFAFDSGALAQTAQPQAGGTELPAPTRAPPTWTVNCNNTQAGLDCRALQMLFVMKTGQRVMTVAVRLAPDNKQPEMLLALPLGVYLPAGVSLQFGKEAAKTVPIESCDQSGCLARYVMSDAELSTMLRGSDVTVLLHDPDKRPVTYTVPVAGFSEVYAKIK